MNTITNKKPTPEETINKVCKVAGLTHPQYHDLVLLTGQVFAYQFVKSLFLANVSHILIQHICKELLQNNVHGFWPFWQNQVYLKSLILIDSATKLCLPPKVAENTLRTMLDPQRVKAIPSTSVFTRKITALVKHMLATKEVQNV